LNLIDIRRPIRINGFRFCVFAASIAYLELRQLRLGQSLSVLIGDVLFFLNLLLIFQILGIASLVTVVVLVYEVSETAAWLYTNSGITFRFLEAFNLEYGFQQTPNFCIGGLAGVILVTAVSYLPLGMKYVMVVSTPLFPLLFLSQAILSFMFVQDKLDTLYPFRRATRNPTSSTSRILNAFRMNMTVHARSSELRNLILFESESLELSWIGRFNSRYPKSMPWLSRLTQNYSYITNDKSQPSTTWSAAGMFVTQCGFPL
jgi:hypothetical protein